MSNLPTKVAPKREDRLKSCITFGGTLCSLRQELGCGCLNDGEREFSQGNICLMLPGIAMLNSLPDNVNLLHGAVGCGVCSHSQNANTRSGNAARFGAIKDGIWLSTAMNEADVIGGGEGKLRRAIIEADRVYRPKTITVVASCVPGITGDDVDGIIDNVQSLVQARVIPVHCEGFKTKIWATAYDAVYHGLAGKTLENPAYQKKIVEDDLDAFKVEQLRKYTVNLFNVSSMGKVDEDELTRLLGCLGYQVNVFPVFAEPEKMYRIKYAALSVSTCPTHDDYFLKYFEKEYNIPYILKHMPIGIENTNEWLRDVGKFFHKEDATEKLIENENAKLNAGLAKYREFFKGKKVFVNAGEFRALATANLLVEMGFEIAAIRSFHHDEFALEEYEKLHKIAGDFPFNVANCQPFEEANLLKKIKPDLFLGHWNGNSTAAKLGIPSHVIYNTGLSYIGYRGAYEIARRLYRQLSNPAFAQKLSKYVRLPYRETWYKEDPFKYIKGGE
ncbi:nitrogenase component 1 [Leadbettera azotonutricia]|uniref:Putative nitrogenase iron-molybdenum protein alpha chain n=1 Tax=Leadbettera azotonutricia (strain ATCC BAA-888 / DSM 13862 / ZAS-9) TaxID=545695 RepID=F5YEN0_LEAAZ|nr:nitrogenase component 1 [Leadbettera azotonutricia]AEF80955.1 putative nitrogenase iron-molybdenum protein alpha chain [Leadbettera azotonutricia ZAS-9]